MINIDEQRFLETINQYSKMDYDLGIVHYNGELLAHTDRNELNKSAEELPFLQSVAAQTEGFAPIRPKPSLPPRITRSI